MSGLSKSAASGTWSGTAPALSWPALIPASWPQNKPLPVAIIGNGGAAAEAVLALRSCGFSRSIHMFSDNPYPPYNPMLGPYIVSGKLPFSQAFPFGDFRSFYERNGVTAHLNEEVVCLDPVEQTLLATSGAAYRYEKCLVASGAECVVPPVEGLPELFTGEPRLAFLLRSADDALVLKSTVNALQAARAGDTPPRAVVVGASLAGVKTASLLHSLGFSVCLVEQQSHILPLTAHPDCARVLESHLTHEGYDLRLGATLSAVRRLSGLRLEIELGPPHDTREQAGLLIFCTGTRPRLGFLARNIVCLDRGILVDAHLCSSVPHLYAAGDVAQGKELVSGRREIIGLWISARRQGRAAGRNLAGLSYHHPGEVRHTITPVGRMLLASIGHMGDYDDIQVIQTGPEMELRLFRQGKLVGLNILGRPHLAGPLRQAMQRAALSGLNEMEVTWPILSL